MADSDYAHGRPDAVVAFSTALARPFNQVSAALKGAQTSASGSGKATYGAPMDMTARNSTVAKMKALGLSSMPAGGQEELDALYAKRGQ